MLNKFEIDKAKYKTFLNSQNIWRSLKRKEKTEAIFHTGKEEKKKKCEI